MKKRVGLLVGCMILCVVGTALFLSVAPDQIPVHFNLQGQVDRMGSKFESLIGPVIGLLNGLILLGAAHFSGKQGKIAQQKMLLNIAIGTLGFFTLLSFIIDVLTLQVMQGGGAITQDLLRWVGGALSALLFYLGMLLPTMERNRWIGIRTPWTLRSDRVWKKTQRVGGGMMVVAGVVSMIISLFAPLSWVLPALTLSALLSLGGAAAYSYWIRER